MPLHVELTEELAVEHVKHPAGCPHHYVGGFGLELSLLATDVGASDAGVTRRAHVVPQRQDHLLDLRTARRN